MISRHKTSVAEKVLKLVASMSKNLKLTLEMYSNGREQGYAIHNANMCSGHLTWNKVAFSESRGSNSIVVYCGETDGLDMGFQLDGNVPSKEVYNNKIMFGPNDHEKAAKHIVKFLSKKPIQLKQGGNHV